MAQLWVGGIDSWPSEDALMRQIKELTGISPKSCWFARDRISGQLQNYGFIDFGTTADASEVLRCLKGSQIPDGKGQRFNLNWGTTKPDQDSELMTRADGFSCYVGNLPVNVDDNKVLQYFRRYFPNVINCRLIYQNGVSRGFGFVKFSTHKEVTEAIRKLNGVTDFGRPLKVSEASQNRVTTNESSEETSATLFLSDLDPSVVTEEILKLHFKQYGTVMSARIDENNPNWATVRMETHQAAESAKNALHGTRFGGATQCIIKWGRSIDDPSDKVETQISVPIMKPPKISNKERAKYFNDSGIERVLNIIQRNEDLNKPCPLAYANAKVANRAAVQDRLRRDMVFGWNSYSASIPHKSFWRYPQ